jgi:hypothetical protein
MLKLKREYAGCYSVEGHNRDYFIFIERSCDVPDMWRCEGQYFCSLSEAKASIFSELLEEV